MVSTRGLVTYWVAKVIAKVLKPLVGKLSHLIQSTSEFVIKVGGLLSFQECLSSYNVTALFISVPIDPALNMVKDLLEQDDALCNRTVLSVQNVVELLLKSFSCIIHTCLQNKFYEHIEGAAMVTGQPHSS